MVVELMVTAVVAWGVGLGMGFYLRAWWQRSLDKPIPKDLMPQISPLPRPPSRSMPPAASLYVPEAEPPAPPAPPVKPKRRLQIHWPTP